MKPFAVSLFISILIIALLPLGCDLYPQYEFQPLEFPFATPADIDYLAAFGIPDWSGPGNPHNGIDLRTVRRTSILSPLQATVTDISYNTTGNLSNPPDLVMVHVTLHVNKEWEISLVFEPSDTKDAILQQQMDALHIGKGDEVLAGTDIGDLLVGSAGYPHLHYMAMQNGIVVCAYAHSTPAAQAIFDQIAALPGNNMPMGTICGK